MRIRRDTLHTRQALVKKYHCQVKQISLAHKKLFPRKISYSLNRNELHMFCLFCFKSDLPSLIVVDRTPRGASSFELLFRPESDVIDRMELFGGTTTCTELDSSDTR